MIPRGAFARRHGVDRWVPRGPRRDGRVRGGVGARRRLHRSTPRTPKTATDEDEEEDEDPEQESEEEEEEEDEELTGKARFEKRDSDSDTDSLPSVPDGSPLPSDYDSDAEPEPEPEHQGPPPYVIPQPLAGKKLVVVVHELRGLPSGYGDGVFCVVECGDALYEATTLGQGAPPRTVWEQWEEFAMRFDEAGANERTTVTAVATDQGPGVSLLRTGGR